ETLGIKSPPFAEGGRPRLASERRQVVEFLRQRDLEVVARYGFVEGQRLHLPPGTYPDLVGVRVERARPAGRGDSAEVVGGGGGRLPKGGDRADPVRQSRQSAEEAPELGVDLLRDDPIPVEEVAGPGPVESRVLPQELPEFGGGTREPGPGHQLRRRDVQPSYLGEADLVDLFGGQVRRGRLSNQESVGRRSVGEGRR